MVCPRASAGRSVQIATHWAIHCWQAGAVADTSALSSPDAPTAGETGAAAGTGWRYQIIGCYPIQVINGMGGACLSGCTGT